MSSRQPFTLTTHDRHGTASCFSFSTEMGDDGFTPLTVSDPGGLTSEIVYDGGQTYLVALNNFVFASVKWFVGIEGKFGIIAQVEVLTPTLISVSLDACCDPSTDSSLRLNVLAFLSDFK